MSPANISAESRARWQATDQIWLDHAVLTDRDLSWLKPAREIIFWAVKVPDGFFAQLPNLEILDVRGGSGTTMSFAENCPKLRGVSVNQIRGLSDLSSIAKLSQLEFLSLYGLPKVDSLPSLAKLLKLKRIEVGSMSGLRGLGGLYDAPNLHDLVLFKKVGVTMSDAHRIAAHPAIKRFSWWAEDVPDKVWVPFVEAVGKPKVPIN